MAVTAGSGSGSGDGYGYGSGYGYGYGPGYGSGSGDGYGSGSGYGSGDGYGYGYGDGYGDGDGYGSGSGDGYGYGDGSGDGYGYGYGSGDGYGYGYGYGDGSGYGYGYGDGYIKAILKQAGNARNAVLAFWKSSKDATPSNGGTGGPRSAGLVEEIEGPLSICTAKALHGTTEPWKWKGERLWIVALHKPVQRQDDKIASLRRTIIKEVPCVF